MKFDLNFKKNIFVLFNGVNLSRFYWVKIYFLIMLLYFVEGFWFILCFMYILKINIFINIYEILLYDNVLYVFINVFIFKICMGCEMDWKFLVRYNNMVKKYIFIWWDLFGLVLLDEIDVFFLKFKLSFV